MIGVGLAARGGHSRGGHPVQRCEDELDSRVAGGVGEKTGGLSRARPRRAPVL